MAKRKRTTQRSHRVQGTDRPGFSRRQLPPPSARGNNNAVLIGGTLVIVLAAAAAGWYFFLGPGSTPGATPSPTAGPTFDTSDLGPPVATPLADPPDEPVGDGTTATIETELGDITFEVFNQSAPVASENFINLADAGFYDGVVFHRLVPDFMIQGGDPEGTGGGGPGYTIVDEPIVGEYTRGVVAMARTSQPNSQGSQFFIVVKDSPFLAGGGYTIFGEVTSGMDVVDQIVQMPTANDEPSGEGGTALEPVPMTTVTITTPDEI
jgi:cyclophilin family peptidyl-prolyl cis-trans isomerase